MPEVHEDELRRHVEAAHECRAAYVESAHVTEQFKGEQVWAGAVAVFSLEGHERADTCFAWSHEVPGTENRHFFVVLKEGPVQSAADAVKAAIAAQYDQQS